MSQISIILDLMAKGQLEGTIFNLEKARDLIGEIDSAERKRATTASSLGKRLTEIEKEKEKAGLSAIKELEKAEKARRKEEEKLSKESLKRQQEQVRLAERQAKEDARREAQLKRESTLIGQIKKQIADQKRIIEEAYDIKTIENANKSLQKLEIQLRQVNNIGKESSNTFGVALGSFQFKFNFLGNLASDLLLRGADLALSFANDLKQIPTQFEKATDTLESITGASAEDLEFYKQQAIAIGPAIGESATDVVKAFELIGSKKSELLDSKEALASVTEQAGILANASNEELPKSAANLTDALNQFSAPASQAGRFINVLAAGAKEGAASIPDITDALLKFGVAAKSSNISIEESTALIEVLADKGIQGAEAGTALRNVLAKLSAPDTLGKEAQASLLQYGVNLERLKDKTIPLKDRLQELAKIQGDASAITKVFGLENKVAAEIILTSTSRFNELTEAVTGTSTALEQAAINIDNAEGRSKILRSTYESLILTIEDGDNILANAFKGLTLGAIASLEALTNFLDGYKRITEESFAQSRNDFIARFAEYNAAVQNEITKGTVLQINRNQQIIDTYQKILDTQEYFKENSPEFFDAEKFFGAQDAIENAKTTLRARQEELDAIKDYYKQQGDAAKAAELARIEAENAASDERKRKAKEEANEADKLRLEQLKKIKAENTDIRKARIRLGVQLAEANKQLLEEQAKSFSLQDPELIARLKSEIQQLTEQLQAEIKPLGIPVVSNLEEEGVYVNRFKAFLGKLKEDFQESSDEIVELAQKFTDRLNEYSEKRIAQIDKEISSQQGIIDIQRDLLRSGKAYNEESLQFEIERQTALENRRAEEQRRIERREKRIAFLNAFSAYAKEQPSTAFGKALALVTLADTIPIFERGGIVEGGKNENGLLIGRRHANKGILIEAEGGEGIFSRREMASLGKENFLNLKEALNKGSFDFYQSTQHLQTIIHKEKSSSDPKLIGKLDAIERAITSRPSLDAMRLDEVGNLITSVSHNGKKVTTVYKKRKW